MLTYCPGLVYANSVNNNYERGEFMKRKQALSFMLSTLLLMSTAISYGDNYSDISQHWAKNSIEQAIKNKIMVGAQGKFMPSSKITRGQLASMLSKALGYKNTTEITYSDVKSSDWYYDPIARLAAKGLAKQGDQYAPKAEMSRKEAFILLSKAFVLQGGDVSLLNNFNDTQGLSSEEKSALAPLVEQKIISGYDNKLNLNSSITRAEFASVMDRLVVRYIDTAGEITGDIQGNVVVRTSGVVFKNAHIKGNIILADGLDEKAVQLDNSTLDGKVLLVASSESIAENKTPLSKPETSSGGGSSSGGSTGGSTGGSSSGGSTGGGSTGGGSNGGNPVTPQPELKGIFHKNVDAKNTKVVDIGYASYLTIVFKEGTAADYTIYVDNTKISTKPVNDENTIVKWEITSLKHKELRIVKNADNTEGIMNLQTKEIIK